jgi:hypothetical protein
MRDPLGLLLRMHRFRKWLVSIFWLLFGSAIVEQIWLTCCARGSHCFALHIAIADEILLMEKGFE